MASIQDPVSLLREVVSKLHEQARNHTTHSVEVQRLMQASERVLRAIRNQHSSFSHRI